MVLAKQRHDVLWNRYNFPISMEGCVLYLPLWQEDMRIAPLLSYDQYHHVGTVTGTVWTPPTGSVLDGDDLIDCGDAASLNITGDQLTVAAWIKSALSWGGLINRTIVGKSVTAGFQFQLTTSGTLHFETESAGEVSVDTTNTITANQWTFVIARYDGATMKIFADAVEWATINRTGNIDSSSGTALTIGVELPSGGSRFFIGSIGEAWVFNRAWSVGEIMNNYQRTKGRYS